MNDTPTTTHSHGTSPSALSSQFRPSTPPLNAKRGTFGPPPPTYESHFTSSPTEESDPTCTSINVTQTQAQPHGEVVQSDRQGSSSHTSSQPRHPRSRKSSTVSTTSVRTTRSTLSKVGSTWRPGAPFLASPAGVSISGVGSEARAVVGAVTVNAAGSISSVDADIMRVLDNTAPNRTSAHVRSKTTSAVPRPLDLAAPTPAMATSSSASASLEPHTASSISSTSGTLSVPPTPVSSGVELRLSPSISRLRSIASSARRRESISAIPAPTSSASTSTTTAASTSTSAISATAQPSSPRLSTISSTTTLVNHTSASPATSTTATIVPTPSDPTMISGTTKGVNPLDGGAGAAAVATESVVEGSRGEVKQVGSAKESLQEKEKDYASVGNGKPKASTSTAPFQSRIPTPSRVYTTSSSTTSSPRPRTSSTTKNLTKRHSTLLKSLPVAMTTSISQMGEIASEGGSLALVGMISGVVEGVGEIGGKGKGKEKERDEGERHVPWLEPSFPPDAPRDTDPPALLKSLQVKDEVKGKEENMERERKEETTMYRDVSPTRVTINTNSVTGSDPSPTNPPSLAPAPVAEAPAAVSPSSTATTTNPPVSPKQLSLPVTMDPPGPTPAMVQTHVRDKERLKEEMQKLKGNGGLVGNVDESSKAKTEGKKPVKEGGLTKVLRETKKVEPTPSSSTKAPAPASAKKDWFSSFTRTKGKAVASVGVAMVQSESSGVGSGEGEERDVRAMLEDIRTAHDEVERAVEAVASQDGDEPGSGEGEKEGDARGEGLLPPVEINVLPATPQLEMGVPTFPTSSSISLPLPNTSADTQLGVSLTSHSTPVLPLEEPVSTSISVDSLAVTPTSKSASTSTPPSPTRSTPRTISMAHSHSRSTPQTPQRKSRSWFSSPLSGSPLGVSVFTASRGSNDDDAGTGNTEDAEESPKSDITSPPTYIPPPSIDSEEGGPPVYAHPPPPPEEEAKTPRRSDSLPSLDSVVPSLPTTPPATGSHTRSFSQSQNESGVPLLRRKTSNASLNASSGRFLLSFGLHGILGLGRDKSTERGEAGKEREEDGGKKAEKAKEGGEEKDGEAMKGFELKEGGEMQRSESEETAVPDDAQSSSVSVSSTSEASTTGEEEDLSVTIRGRPEKSDKARGKERDVEGGGGEKSTSRTRNGNGWWGIVGWGSSTTSVNVGGEEKKENKDEKVEEEGHKEDAVQAGTVDGDEREGEGTVKGVPQVVQEEGVEEAKNSEEEKPVEGEEKKEEVSVSATTTEKENGVVVGSSAWFARWTWYGAGDVGGGEETKKVEEHVEVETRKADDGPKTPTPPEPKTKEENAVVRAQNQPVVEPSSPPTSKPSLLDDNPLSSTMSTAAQRSIWSSIFASTYTKTISKSGSMKAIEDGRTIDNVERDEHGVEIMDIESEDESPPTPNISSSPPLASAQPKSPERKSRGWAGPMRMMVSAVSSSRDASVERRQSNPTGPKSSMSSQNGNNPDITGSTTTTTTNATTTSKNMPGDSANGKGGVKGGQTVASGDNTPTPTPTTSTASTSQSTAGSSSLTTTTLSTFTALTKRTSSPAPSTSSSNGGSSKPNGPPPPNLVLPTWEDTFFVPPRSYVDPPPPFSSPSRPGSPGEESVLSKGIIGGALRLVSGVLGSPQQPPPQTPAHSTTRRRGSSQPPSPELSPPPPNPFRYFGRELPKAYQVLEEAGYDTSAPPEYSPSPAYSHLSSSPPRFSSPRSARSPSLPRNQSSSPPQSATSGFSFFGGGPKRAASPPPEMPEPAPMEEVRDVLRGCKRVVVIGVHGWFPGAMIRTVLGEPTGTSSKFANMMALALHQFELEMDVKFEKVTKVVLEGEGEVKRRVDKLYSTLLSHPTHLTDIHRADAILVATHSQGSVVSTHILDRLIKDRHIVTHQSLAAQIFGGTQAADEEERRGEVLGVGGEVYPGSLSGLPSPSSASASTSTSMPSSSTPVNTDGLSPSSEADAPPLSARTTSTTSAFDTSKPRKPQRVCCLAMCGIHLGPLRYLNTSGFVGPYIQYLESPAARELFEFQNTESPVSKAYVKALEGVLDAGVKMVYVASLNDQVVPIYSGLFTAVHHPSILRALYIDGDAYSTSDFLCALLVLLIRIINASLPDSGLIAHLSEATAGSLSGIGHSSAYEELATYMLAVKYLFLVDEGAMGNVNVGSLESQTHRQESAVPSPVPPSAQAPFFLSPTFSSFPPHMHSPFSASFSPTPSSPLPPLPKPSMHFTPFSAHLERNDYEIPWSLRDLIAHPIISHLFYKEIEELRDKFGEWNPKTAVLRDVKRKVSPIARLGSLSGSVYGMGMGGGGFGGVMGGGSKL